jgi:hypothetical protein
LKLKVSKNSKVGGAAGKIKCEKAAKNKKKINEEE